MSFAANLKNFLISKKWFLLGFILLLIMSMGGFYGWKHYQYLQSPQHFLSQLNAATQSNDFVTLAKLVDFRGIAEDISKQIVRAPIPPSADKPRETDYLAMSDKIQNDFIIAMENKDKDTTTKTANDPLSSLEPLPKDFAAQISGKFELQTTVEDEGLISVSVNYPRLDKKYKLLFTISKNPEWKITRFNNTAELIEEYIAEENKLEVLRDLKFQKDNAEMQASMLKQFTVKQCTAFLHTTSDGQSSLFVRVNGYNNGPYIILNMTFETNVTVHGVQGNLEFKHDLNMAARLLPGVDLIDSYSIELDQNNERDEKILSAQEFSCTARIRLMTLSNGKLLFTKRHRLAQ